MNNKGVSVIALVITIIVLVLITSITVYNGINMIDRTRKKSATDRLMTVAVAIASHEKELGFKDTLLGGAVSDCVAIDDNNTDTVFTDDKLVKPMDEYGNQEMISISDNAFVQVDSNNYRLMGLSRFADQEEVPPMFILKAPSYYNPAESIYILKTPKILRKSGVYTNDDYLWYEYKIYSGEVKDNYKMEFDEQKGVNRPLLTEDMIPVKNYFAGDDFDRFSPVYVDDVYKDDWYNYSKESPMWANVMFRDTTDSSILANRYYVWIPRFAYRVQDFYKGADYESIPSSAIDIVFLREDTDYMANDDIIPTGFQVHPAFKYLKEGGNPNNPDDMINIPGFWIAKDYVATVDSIYSSGYGTQKNALDIIEFDNLHPDAVNSRSVVTSRLIKNTEWAAVAYLSMYTVGKITNGNSLNDNPSGVINLNIDVGHVVAGGLNSIVTPHIPYADKYELSGDRVTYYSYESKSIDENSNKPYTYNKSERKYGDAMIITSSGSGDHSSWFEGYSINPTIEYPYILRGDKDGNMFSYRAIANNSTSPAVRNVLIVENK